MELQRFLAAISNFAHKQVAIEDFGTVTIRELSAIERVRVTEGMYYNGKPSDPHYYAQVVRAGLVEPRLADEHIDALLAGRNDILRAIGEAIIDLSQARRVHLRGGDPTPDGGQLDAQGGAPLA